MNEEFLWDSNILEVVTFSCHESCKVLSRQLFDTVVSLLIVVVSNDGPEVPALGADDRDDNKSSFGSQTCNVSDFFISDMIITSIPFDGNVVEDNISGTNSFPDFECSEPSMLFDAAEQYMILPFLEDTVKANDINYVNLHEEAMMVQDNTGLCLAIDQMRSCIQESDVKSDSDQADDFDPQSFIKNLPELSDVVSSFQPAMVPKEAWRRKPITLVLDLDGKTYMFCMLFYCVFFLCLWDSSIIDSPVLLPEHFFN